MGDMVFLWPRDANPYLRPTDRRRVFASVRREADRAWRQWLAENPRSAWPPLSGGWTL